MTDRTLAYGLSTWGQIIGLGLASGFFWIVGIIRPEARDWSDDLNTRAVLLCRQACTGRL